MSLCIQNFVPPELRTSRHVFVCNDTIRKPLEQPYQGPFKKFHRKEKFFTININGSQATVSNEWLKLAYVQPDVSSEKPECNLAVSECQKDSKPVINRSSRRFRLVEPCQTS
ncbi:hypothetical protein AVEN_66894-1 [Araneus ventricosus]|uniref:Uncharacterized protein n=1 Tax=Araneus ventricosus TaxID=182803 RepID=A0A4Y2Q5L6_ARAVE|nr:hypothetical protein AVEN_66894-1 [Araneus ventricosus]